MPTPLVEEDTETVAEAVPQARNESSQRIHELLDEVARKDSALLQFRTLFESLSKDYEVVQRNGERMKSELDALTAKHATQQQELTAVKAKSAMQESRIKQEDDVWDRRTRQMRQELAAAIEERDGLANEREAQWQQIRMLRSQLGEQQRQRDEDEDVWKRRLEEIRRETEEKVRLGMREREDVLRLREVELQRSTSQLESRLADVCSEARRQQETNEALMLRIDDLQRSLQQQERMTRRIQDALTIEQKEKAQLGEYMSLERQTYRQRLEQTENSYKAQVQEMQRLCDQHLRERERLESEISRFQRESQQEAQRARELWLQQKQQLEATIESLRGDLTRDHMRFDKSNESLQRVETLLVRTQRDLEASQQQETTLRETISSLHKAAAKREATQVRLEGEITRLLAVVAERERETERWRSAVDRIEWQNRLEAAREEVKNNEHMLPEALPPPPPPPSYSSSLPLPMNSARRHNPPRRGVWETPHREFQHVESIDHTPSADSPIMNGINKPLMHVDEDKEELMLRSIVQEVLQECMAQTDPSSSTHVPNSVYARHASSATVGSNRRAEIQHRRSSSSRIRRHARTTDTRVGNGSTKPSMASPLPVVHSTPLWDATTTRNRVSPNGKAVTMMMATAVPGAPSLSTTSNSANSSILQSAAPLFTSTPTNSQLDSSAASQPPRNILSTGRDDNEVVSQFPVGFSPRAPLSECEADVDAATSAALIQKITRDREETGRQMRQTLRDLEQRQQNIISSVQGGGAMPTNSFDDASLVRRKETNGNATNDPNASQDSSIAASATTSATGHFSTHSSSARASTAAPAPSKPSRLMLLQERFETMPIVQQR